MAGCHGKPLFWPMARILIAWELGGAFGHLTRCQRLAEGLAARGDTVTLVLKDVRLPAGQCLAPGISVLPAPLTPQAVARNSPVNYADMLLASGFADAQDVVARLNAWRGIMTLVRPDMLLADHAPTALLAARLFKIPHLAIGNGFMIPPAVFPWPSIRPWESVSDLALVAAEAELDRVTGVAQKALGYMSEVRIRELFGAHDVLDTFVELDHYGERLGGYYAGPIVSVLQALRVDWQSQEGRRVLAYLRPTVPGFIAIVQALARLDAEVLCVVPGMNPDVAKQCCTRRLRIALAPVDLPPLLKDADLALSYGNGGFSTQALLAGVPLLMRPQHVEQALFAHRVEALGAGRLLSGRINVETVMQALHELLDNSLYRQAAGVFQARYRHFSNEKAIEQRLSFMKGIFLGDGNADGIQDASKIQETSAACLH